MYGYDIYCLMVSRPGLSDENATKLFKMACLMLQNHENSAFIEGEDYAGVIRTKREVVLLGTLSGLKFEAEIETNETGKLVVHYLVRECDVEEIDFEKAAWVSLGDISFRQPGFKGSDLPN